MVNADAVVNYCLTLLLLDVLNNNNIGSISYLKIPGLPSDSGQVNNADSDNASEQNSTKRNK